MADDPKEHRVDASEVAKQVLAALKQEKGESVSEALIRENVIAREKRREAEEALADLKKGLPAKDAVILTGDDAKSWTTLKEKGLTKADDLVAAVARKDELEAKDARRTRDDAMRSAARASGYDGEALSKIAGVDVLEFETREETVAGEKKQIAYVTPPGAKAGEKGSPVKLDDWIGKNVPAAMATALKATTDAAPAYPDQSGGEQPPKTKTYDPVAAGKEMAKTQKAEPNSLAFQ